MGPGGNLLVGFRLWQCGYDEANGGTERYVQSIHIAMGNKLGPATQI